MRGDYIWGDDRGDGVMTIKDQEDDDDEGQGMYTVMNIGFTDFRKEDAPPYALTPPR